MFFDLSFDGTIQETRSGAGTATIVGQSGCVNYDQDEDPAALPRYVEGGGRWIKLLLLALEVRGQENTAEVGAPRRTPVSAER